MSNTRIKEIQNKYTEPRGKAAAKKPAAKSTASKRTPKKNAPARPAEVVEVADIVETVDVIETVKTVKRVESVKLPKRAANSEILAIAVVVVTIFYFVAGYFLPEATIYPSNADLLVDMGLIVITLFSLFWIINRAWVLAQTFKR